MILEKYGEPLRIGAIYQHCRTIIERQLSYGIPPEAKIVRFLHAFTVILQSKTAISKGFRKPKTQKISQISCLRWLRNKGGIFNKGGGIFNINPID